MSPVFLLRHAIRVILPGKYEKLLSYNYTINLISVKKIPSPGGKPGEGTTGEEAVI